MIPDGLLGSALDSWLAEATLPALGCFQGTFRYLPIRKVTPNSLGATADTRMRSLQHERRRTSSKSLPGGPARSMEFSAARVPTRLMCCVFSHRANFRKGAGGNPRAPDGMAGRHRRGPDGMAGRHRRGHKSGQASRLRANSTLRSFVVELFPRRRDRGPPSKNLSITY